MPPKKSNPKKKAPEKFVPEFSSDDEIPEIEEEEDEEDEGIEDRHPDDACQPDKADEKAEDSKTKKRSIPGGSRPSPTPSAAKSTKLTKEKMDKELVKSPVPYWSDPKFGNSVLGIIQIITIITSVYVFVSMRNSLEHLKSCQKRDTTTDSSQPCADCTCIATDGFSSKELSNIIERQNKIDEKVEEKYREVENSVKDMERKLSANDDRLSGFESRDTVTTQDFEKEIFKLNAKIAEFSNNPIDLIAVFDREWEKRRDILMKEFDRKESSLKDILDKKVQETEAKVNSELELMIKSKGDLQLQEINQNIEEQMKAVKNTMMENVTSGLKERLKSFDSKFEKVDGELDFIFREIHNLNFLDISVVGVLLLVVIGVIFVAYKSLISRKAPSGRTGRPSETPRKESQSQSFDAKSEKQKRKELKKGMLIVSFHPSTQQFHHDALNALSEFMKTLPVKVLIQDSKDLMNVEPHKLVIIFVDFNNRNIILENKDAEIGNLRNETTQLFLSHKCDVFVVYCKDKGSQDLQPSNLYNPKLYSIERHPVLSELKRNNRVLSINDKFHPHQVEHLKKCCQQL